MGMWPGPSIITCTSCSQAILVSSPSVSSSANCARSLASARDPGRSPSPSEKLTSYFWKILQMSLEMLVQQILAMVLHHPFGENRAAAADDAGDAPGGQRDVLHQHAGVDGHVIDALLGLLLDHFEHHVDIQILDAPHARERFIDRHGPDGHGRMRR